MVTIQYLFVNRKFEIVTREKSFKTDAACAKWIEKALESGQCSRVLRSTRDEN
jgi:thiamine monophosphate synthase